MPAVLRDARYDDLAALVDLAAAAGPGLTTFPADAAHLERRLAASAEGREPLFVLEDAEANRVLGVSGLVRSVVDRGATDDAEPFYAYRIERRVHRSDSLDVRHEVEALHLVADHDGPTEIGTLFLHPDARGAGLGRLLSLGRFLYMANAPETFGPGVIAELRGVVDEHGRSPFWEALGRHFFKVDYAVADAMSARDKRFIAELMPTHPVYVPLLPEAARDVIGRVHPHTAPAKRLLESEGFHATKLVDIFDAGPALRCDLRAIRTVQQSAVVAARIDDTVTNDEPPIHLLSTTMGAFVVVQGAADIDASTAVARISPDSARLLGVQTGDQMRVAPLR